MPSASAAAAWTSVDAVVVGLAGQKYVADRPLATAVFVAAALGRPLFLEGQPGVGKTELAKALAAALGRELIRLQCYEGLDVAQTAYEWNVARQMIEIRLAEAGHLGLDAAARQALSEALWSRDMLLERPLLRALTRDQSPILLIDELDRADEPFDAFLLEVLAENQITIPELGTVAARAGAEPFVVVTSNRTREVHDALKRRCLYHWLDYPDAPRELEIVRRRSPGADARLGAEVVAFVQKMRELDLYKSPGIAETIDWVNALAALDAMSLDPQTVHDTLGVLLKHRDDIARLTSGDLSRLLADSRSARPA